MVASSVEHWYLPPHDRFPGAALTLSHGRLWWNMAQLWPCFWAAHVKLVHKMLCGASLERLMMIHGMIYPQAVSGEKLHSLALDKSEWAGMHIHVHLQSTFLMSWFFWGAAVYRVTIRERVREWTNRLATGQLL